MTLFSASGAVDFAKRVFERILKLRDYYGKIFLDVFIAQLR
jgi:hypothetical protein